MKNGRNRDKRQLFYNRKNKFLDIRSNRRKRKGCREYRMGDAMQDDNLLFRMLVLVLV